jgi:hypothetical protein
MHIDLEARQGRFVDNGLRLDQAAAAIGLKPLPLRRRKRGLKWSKRARVKPSSIPKRESIFTLAKPSIFYQWSNRITAIGLIAKLWDGPALARPADPIDMAKIERG